MTDTTEFTPTIDPSNATVQAMFGAVLQQKIQGGALEQALSKYADKLIDDCAQDVLRSYGDVGKAVKEALTKAIMPNIDDLSDFPSYHDFVTKRRAWQRPSSMTSAWQRCWIRKLRSS